MRPNPIGCQLKTPSSTCPTLAWPLQGPLRLPLGSIQSNPIQSNPIQSNPIQCVIVVFGFLGVRPWADRKRRAWEIPRFSNGGFSLISQSCRSSLNTNSWAKKVEEVDDHEQGHQQEAHLQDGEQGANAALSLRIKKLLKRGNKSSSAGPRRSCCGFIYRTQGQEGTNPFPSADWSTFKQAANQPPFKIQFHQFRRNYLQFFSSQSKPLQPSLPSSLIG